MSECLLVVGAMASRFIGEGWLEGVCLSVFLGCVCTALGKALLGGGSGRCVRIVVVG